LGGKARAEKEKKPALGGESREEEKGGGEMESCSGLVHQMRTRGRVCIKDWKEGGEEVHAVRGDRTKNCTVVNRYVYSQNARRLSDERSGRM